MSDKTIIIIFCALNVLMWMLFLSYVRQAKKEEFELMKHYAEAEKKHADYLHLVHGNINEMLKLNLSAMNEFIGEISDKMKDGEKNAEKNRE